MVMPFGLTNAPAIFQALMNDILHDYIRRFVLVFFDDILIYSSTWAEHMQHIKVVFDLMRQHRLFIKHSKCTFGSASVSYLGHIISEHGVAMDPDKIAAVDSWPTPRMVHALRGFLGLAGYYQKFIARYGNVARPLTTLLKRDSFRWSPEAEQSFQDLKKALMTVPLLQLADFDKAFIIECDASGSGFGAVLHQGDGTIAFFSRVATAHHTKLPTYERELIELIKAIRHWRPYVWGRSSIVSTDHFSLKYILDQRLTTIPQHTWVSKLFGYDFSVEYRQGKLNVVVDALSRRTEDSMAANVLSSPTFDLYDQLRQECLTLSQAVQLRAQIADNTAPPGWSEVDGLLLFHGRILIPDDSLLWPAVLEMAHTMGHEGGEKTLHRFRATFYSQQAHRRVREFVRSCAVCQRNKTEHLHPRVCCNRFQYRNMCGVILQWISWRVFQKLAVNQ
jgi:hypothetical protein